MWSWAVWATLAFAVIAFAVTVFGAGRETFRFIRQLGRSRRALFGELDAAAAKAENAALKAEALGGGSERLTQSLARLSTSRRRLAVLQTAWDEATDVVGAITSVYPRK
jgi:hypothetical protein